MNFTELFGSLKFDMYWFFNSKTYNPEEEITSIFDIDDYDQVKFEVGKTYTFNVDDLSVDDVSDENKNDYEQYIKDKNQITILINWIKIENSDQDGKDCNIGFSFISH